MRFGHLRNRDARLARQVVPVNTNYKKITPTNLAKVDLRTYDKYKCSLQQNIRVCHIMEHMGVGGAQVMAIELFNGLNKYFGHKVTNFFIGCADKNPKHDIDLFSSYGVVPYSLNYNELSQFCIENCIDVVIQHRISDSRCLKRFLPKNTKYLLVNHTWNNMFDMKNFIYCDAYVSVCSFLHSKTQFASTIDNSKKYIVLNGIENDFIKQIEPAKLEGSFKTGRCHRLVAGKFNIDSLKWMDQKIIPPIKHYSHYIIGDNREAEAYCKQHRNFHYLGPIHDRQKKFSIIKGLDLYFYETFRPEGASIAILEGLACGVPVLTKPYGGCPELVSDGINGRIAADRVGYFNWIKQLHGNRPMLEKLKKTCIADFENRLHVKHCCAKYMQIFERIFR